MSQTKYHLDSLLRLRKSEMDAELVQLYRCVRDLHVKQERIRETEVEHHAVIHSIRESDQDGNDLGQLIVHRHYLARLRDEAKEHAEIADRLAKAADEVREQVEMAVNRYRIVENLSNRRRTQNRERVTKITERIVEDEITTRFAKRVQIENEKQRVASRDVFRGE